MSLNKKAFHIVQQLEYYDTNDINEIFSRCMSLANVKKCAVIIHDRDVRKEDGAIKAPHFHAVITFSNQTSSLTVANRLGVPENQVNKCEYSPKTNFLYLIHKNDPDKFPYSSNDVVANFDYVDFADNFSPAQSRESISQRVESGDILPFDILPHLNMDTYAKNKNYFNNCVDFALNKDANKTVRELNCIYIQGPAGV